MIKLPTIIFIEGFARLPDLEETVRLHSIGKYEPRMVIAEFWPKSNTIVVNKHFWTKILHELAHWFVHNFISQDRENVCHRTIDRFQGNRW